MVTLASGILEDIHLTNTFPLDNSNLSYSSDPVRTKKVIVSRKDKESTITKTSYIHQFNGKSRTQIHNSVLFIQSTKKPLPLTTQSYFDIIVLCYLIVCK